MPEYVALLRGVSPVNAKMADLRDAFTAAGFTRVKTVLASGNVLFDSLMTCEDELEAACRDAMGNGLGRVFPTIIRPLGELRAIVEADPFAGFEVAPQAKPVVTFLHHPPAVMPQLPIIADGVSIFFADQRSVYTAYVVNSTGPVFMNLIETTFGKDVTTRTWQTVRRCATA